MPLVAEKLVTAEEFACLPDPSHGGKMELVRGRIVVMAPVGPDHGERAVDIGGTIRSQTKKAGLGKVRVETGYWFGADPDHILAPDVSFVRASRLAGESIRHGAVTQVPDLAVEITSPSDREPAIQQKVRDYLDAGVERVWVVRPERANVTVYRADGPPRTFSGDAVLTNEDAAIPGDAFALPLAEIFS